MFRTVSVHLQEQLYKLYIAFGICRYHTCGCCVAIATQQPSAFTHYLNIRMVDIQTNLSHASSQIPRKYLIENNRLLRNPIQFIIHQSPCLSTKYGQQY